MFSERRNFFSVLFWTTAASLLLQSIAFQLCEYSYRILHDMSSNQWNMIFKPMPMKAKQMQWLTFAKSVNKTRNLPIKYIIAKYVLARFTQT